MAIVTCVAFILTLIAAALLSDQLRLAAKGDQVLLWGARILLGLVILGCVWFVDNFVWSIPNPFDGPHVEVPELPEREPPKNVTPKNVTPKNVTLEEAAASHSEKIKDWEER